MRMINNSFSFLFFKYFYYICIVKLINIKVMRPIYEIAAEIKKVWKNMPDCAKVYVDAMFDLTTIDDNYMFDSGKSIVLYFLSNASSWRGEDARRIKAELNKCVNK